MAHGFRFVIRGGAAQETDHAREVIQVVLAHVVPSKIKGAYARWELFEQRLTADLAAYLGHPRGDGVLQRS